MSRDIATKYTVAIADVLGGIEIIRTETSEQGVICSPSIKTQLQFTAKPNKVEVSTSNYTRLGSGREELDGTKVELLKNPADEVKRRAINNQGKQSTVSQFTILVNPEQAERFKKAFDVLFNFTEAERRKHFKFMKHSTNRSIGMAFMLTGALLLCAPALHAAITDADLAKVTQLIQEGKTTRAKAEITILLDDNPNDPNAPNCGRFWIH